MTNGDFNSLLESIGIPFAYHHFKDSQNLPFGVWAVNGEPDFMADNRHYLKNTSAYVEYYFEIKDINIENKIKKVFAENDIPYSFDYELYIEDKKMFVIRYLVQFTGG